LSRGTRLLPCADHELLEVLSLVLELTLEAHAVTLGLVEVGEYSGNVQGTFREHSRNNELLEVLSLVLELTLEAHAVTLGLVEVGEYSGNIPGTFREHSGNIRGTMSCSKCFRWSWS
jgi:multisubunit Na+/H+ antiporter MnhC subunit